MDRFHVMIHVRPRDVMAGPACTLQGQEIATVAIDPASASVPFGVTFEEAATRLEALAGMFIEPDGAFVWRSRGTAALAWQVDGELYDRDDRLAYVEVRGTCPLAEFDQLLAACGWPLAPLMVQLAREAVFLDVEEFRRYLVAGRE